MSKRYIKKEIDEALELISNDALKALKIFDDILKIEPENINVINGKGFALIKLNKLEEAEKYFNKSLDIEKNSSALINKGIIAKNKKKYDQSLIYYDLAIEIDPNMQNIVNILKNEIYELMPNKSSANMTNFSAESNSYIKRGLHYKNNHEIWKALECFNQAIIVDSTCENFVNALTDEIDTIIFNDFLFKTPMFKDCKVDHLKIQALKELLVKENINKALKIMNQILNMNKNDIDTLNYKGCTLFLMGKYDNAIDCFDKCLSLDNDYYYSLFNKGLVLRRKNELIKSLTCFTELLKFNKEHDKIKEYQLEILSVLQKMK